ncbi:MAG TPA: YceI family protein [Terriglobia bacterium]|nr:YceI family protein [Terriglobia bacterium]
MIRIEIIPLIRLVLLSCTMALLLCPSDLAQDVVLEFDSAQTQINFTLGDILHTVHGTFTLKRSRLEFNPSTGQVTGLVVVDSSSGQSGNEGRDRKMHKEVLESNRFPEITFKPVSVRGHIALQGDSEVEVGGNFDLHGVDHDITLKAHLHIADDRLVADIHFPVPYVNWGLKNPSTFILRVSETVSIDLHATGRLMK